jgi:hypothetical protein
MDDHQYFSELFSICARWDHGIEILIIHEKQVTGRPSPGRAETQPMAV